jgi:SET domain-containing protein
MTEMPTYCTRSSIALQIYPSRIPGAGLGVVALQAIPHHTRVDEYYGQRIEEERRVNSVRSNYFFFVSPSLGIDAAAYPRCMMAMINDATVGGVASATTNCEFEVDHDAGRVYVRTLRDIVIGEELFVSYGHEYWSLHHNRHRGQPQRTSSRLSC